MNRNIGWKIVLVALIAGRCCDAFGMHPSGKTNAQGIFSRNDDRQTCPSASGLSHFWCLPDTLPGDRWEVLFDKNNAHEVGNIWRGLDSDTFPSDIWKVEDGMLFVQGQKWPGDIITREKFTNFILVFEFKLTRAANGGIKYFVNKIENNHIHKMFWNGPEYQIIDEYNNVEIKDDPNGVGSTAALYLLYKPMNKKLNPPGEWNRGKIVVKGNHVEHWLNGVRVVNYERGSKDYRDRIVPTKFSHYDHYGEVKSGHIMLTDHDGDKVLFRRIAVKRLK